MTDAPPSKPPRLASLDQFRGYTVAGMLLVNFLGSFAVVPAVLKHHNTYCSYADTIMPQFFFAVGFALRLTFVRRVEAVGTWKASAAVLRRCAGLAVLGVALYHLEGGVKSWAQLQALGVGGFLRTAFSRGPFETLVHIALATVWVLPVIGARPSVRWAFLVLTALLHLGLSRWFYFDWVWHKPGIDGGPLGFMSWAEPVLVGSLAFDAVRRGGPTLRTAGMLCGWAAGLMAVGYGLSCLGGMPAAPPFVAPDTPVNLWTMSQRTGSISYQTFGAGWSLAVFALFLVVCDRPGARHRFEFDSAVFRAFGRNALVAYVLHGIVAGAVKEYVPKDSPGWYVAAGFALYFAANVMFVRGLEKDGVYVRM